MATGSEIVNLNDLKAVYDSVSDQIDATASTKANAIEKTASGNVVSIADGANNQPVAELVANIDPVQSGSGDPSPDNVRPITGWTGANVYRMGKNLAKISASTLFNEQNCTSAYTNTGITVTASGTYARSGHVFPVKIGCQYTVSFTGMSTGDYNTVYIGKAREWNSSYARPTLSETSAAITSTFVATTDTLFVGFYVTSGATSGAMTITNFQLELGSTATAYEPYQGQTVSVDWTSAAGTVYGGNLNVTTGVLTVTHAKAMLSSLSWTVNANASNSFNGNGLNDRSVKLNDTSMISNVYTSYTSIDVANHNNGIAFGNNNTVVFIKDTRAETVAGLTEILTNEGACVIYELATPTTVQLTPQEVTTLLGTNSIWANTGDVSVTYRADTKTYIDNKIADAIAAAIASL